MIFALLLVALLSVARLTRAEEIRVASRRAVRDAFLQGLKPEPRITVSEWADSRRILTRRSSAQPGRWRTSRTPYLREIMDCLSATSQVQDLTFAKGSQIGGTEVGNNWLGYVIDHAPGPMMLVMPSDPVLKRKSRQTLDGLIEDTPSLAAKVSQKKSRDPGNTTLQKVFPGGMLVLASAESASSLRSMATRYLFLDEVDGFPVELPGEGDPAELAERGTKTFSNRKVFRVSTPTVKGKSRIWKKFEDADRRYFHVPCPFCAKLQRIEWKRIRWEQGDDETDERVALELAERKRVAWMECAHCAARIDEHQKDVMLAGGIWIPEDPSLGERVRSYHLSALYSPHGFYSWSDAAARFLRAKHSPAKLRVWVNQDLGEPYKEQGDAPEWRNLWERREHYTIGTVPRGGRALTAGVDVQADRFEIEVVAWGPGLEAWSVEYLVLPADTKDPASYVALDRLLVRAWPCADGGEPVRLAAMLVDTGHEAQKVYGWAHRFRRSGRVYCGKGVAGGAQVMVGMPKPVEVAIGGGKRVRRGVQLWPVDVGMIKAELFDQLELRPPVSGPHPEGYCHFPQYGPDYFKGLCSEVLVRRRLKTGRIVMDWEKIRERNEPLDCRVYARAAAFLQGLDHLPLQAWDEIRKLSSRLPALASSRVAPAPEEPTPAAPPPPPAAPRRERKDRRGWGSRKRIWRD